MGWIRRTSAARRDYRDIYLYIAERNITSAESILRRFDEVLELISEMPHMGRGRPELGGGLRSFPVGNYILFYKPVEGGIELIRVIHAARNMRNIFRRRR